MHKLSKNTALGYLTLLVLALFATGRNLVLWLSQISFLELLGSASQLFATISCGLWLFGRIWDELLNKNRADIFKYTAAASGLIGFILGALNLIINSRSLNAWGWAVNLVFTLFILVWTLYTSLKVINHKSAGLFLWIMSIFSIVTLILLAAQTAAEIYQGFMYFSPDVLFLFIIMLILDLLGLFSPVIYAVYEGISSLRAQHKKPALPRR